MKNSILWETITESVSIKNTVESVFSAFANLPRWKDILPDVLDVKVLYDDGYNQEFTMTVERPTGEETVRGIRYCVPNVSLELFQPEPPPGFQYMIGQWKFFPDLEGTLVVGTRRFVLTPEEQNNSSNINELAGKKLRGYLKHNLSIFKTALEQ
ncbi:MAG: SRPBCC family protein [Candidatus Parabeggiatoa sp.]|nr:SRPBCC family protein [Candidatus Parabeggiatoa sp.]